MKSLLLLALAGYIVAAVHAVLAFINKRRSVERVSLGALAFAFVLHSSALVLDWVQNGHYPLVHLSETLSFLAWTLVIAYALAVHRYRARALGSLTLPLIALLVLMAILKGNAARGAIPPNGATTTWLLPLHVTLLMFSYASFFVVFAASLMYLWQERELKHKTFTAFFHRLPSLTTVNDIGNVSAAIGFTLLTLGIIIGVVWSSELSGVPWHNDPKEVFALLTWLLYLALIHYREQLRGRKAAWIGIAGFALVLFTFLGARMMGGYHVFG